MKKGTKGINAGDSIFMRVHINLARHSTQTTYQWWVHSEVGKKALQTITELATKHIKLACQNNHIAYDEEEHSPIVAFTHEQSDFPPGLVLVQLPPCVSLDHCAYLEHIYADVCAYQEPEFVLQAEMSKNKYSYNRNGSVFSASHHPHHPSPHKPLQCSFLFGAFCFACLPPSLECPSFNIYIVLQTRGRESSLSDN